MDYSSSSDVSNSLGASSDQFVRQYSPKKRAKK